VSPDTGVPGRVAARAGAVRERVRREVRALAQDESLEERAAAYRVWPVRSTHGARIDLGEHLLDIPGLACCSERITWMAAGACSIGRRLERRVATLFRARRRLHALELDALGTEWLFALSDRIVARIRRDARRAGLRASAELNPGDAGLALGEQHAVLALAEARSQGITTTRLGMLSPVKSLTFVVALGDAIPESSALRCDRCAGRHRCSIRPT